MHYYCLRLTRHYYYFSPSRPCSSSMSSRCLMHRLPTLMSDALRAFSVSSVTEPCSSLGLAFSHKGGSPEHCLPCRNMYKLLPPGQTRCQRGHSCRCPKFPLSGKLVLPCVTATWPALSSAAGTVTTRTISPSGKGRKHVVVARTRRLWRSFCEQKPIRRATLPAVATAVRQSLRSPPLSRVFCKSLPCQVSAAHVTLGLGHEPAPHLAAPG